ncbi:cytochrome P450 [Micromonospora siamensis]|uniref:Cytochrome P450 n=1 Tax=Micromonospora siamensis TaxID=299152 RepID=A0A1C5IUT5_9ACTN|nr:cytochrome P450 [Micromonospora siamensis]SCG61719.1 Cytochrome P450 [Micromonospora siamensis]
MTHPWPVVDPAPDTPPCGAPTRDPGTGWSVTRYADVRAALTDPALTVPAVGPAGPPGTLAWLRATVSRFSGPDQHRARRAYGVAALADLDPDGLRAEAASATAAILDRAGNAVDVIGSLARRVPVEVLAGRLGLDRPELAGPAVADVAAAYHPGVAADLVHRADAALADLLALSPAGEPERTANRLGLLVQACDATAGLIAAGARHLLDTPAGHDSADLLAEVFRLDPPVRGTRRVAVAPTNLGGRDVAAGEAVLLRFDAANRDPAVFGDPDRFVPGRPDGALTFGAGPRGCPGERHALALAAGVLDVLRGRCRPAPGPVRYAPHPTLRVPTSLEVRPR